jgi:L,D-transpeptidase ErfK/SrfK
LARRLGSLAATSFILAALIAAGSASAASYSLPENGDDVIGAVTALTLTYEDTIAAIAEKYGIGYRELVDANPDVDPWLPGEGTRIQLPTAYVLPSAPREGLVINVAEYRIYYYPPGANKVVTFPVGVGRMDFPTPLIKTRVVTRIANPSWTPTESARREHAEMGDPLPFVVPPGPQNPLGHLALQLGVPGYFIHGTNKPFGVGQMVSHGCIRLYPGHIETLAGLVPNGTPVFVVNEPYKVGWRSGELYAEAHKDLYTANRRTDLVRKIIVATQSAAEDGTDDGATSISWQRVDKLGANLTGVPVRVSG